MNEVVSKLGLTSSLLITTLRYGISFISYFGDTFLHNSVQLKNLFTALFFLNSLGLPLLAFAFFFSAA
jgi:hypothetical protein